MVPEHQAWQIRFSKLNLICKRMVCSRNDTRRDQPCLDPKNTHTQMLPVPASTRSQHPVPPPSDSRPDANTVTQPTLVTSRSARNTTPAIPIRLAVTLRNAPHPVRPLATSNRAYPRWADSPLRTPLSFNCFVPSPRDKLMFGCCSLFRCIISCLRIELIVLLFIDHGKRFFTSTRPFSGF